MTTNRTFTMIKPDGVENGHIGGILNMITEGGFRIVSMKLTQLTMADAQKFYAVHSERPFFGELVEFMTRVRCAEGDRYVCENLLCHV